MKLGSFWGLTAPMAILAFDDDESIFDLIYSLNSSLSKRVLLDFKTELAVLKRVITASRIEAPFAKEESVTKVYRSKCDIASGTAVGNISNPELVLAQLLYEMTCSLAILIVEGEASGKYVSLSDEHDLQETLATIVKSEIANKSFPIAKSKVIIQNLYNQLICEDGKSYRKSLRSIFQLKRGVPSVVSTQGKRVTLTASAKKIWSYFLNTEEHLDKIYRIINFTSNEIEVVFDMNFSDLMKRKPESLHYIVANAFDYVKSKQNSTFLVNVMAEVKGQLELCRKCMTEHVRIYGEEQEVDVLAVESYTKITETFSSTKKHVFTELVEAGVLRISDLTVSDLEHFSLLYDKCSNLNLPKLNQSFGISANVQEWETLIPELCEIGIYGLNFSSLDLFRESISNISLARNNKIVKTSEEFDQLNKVLADIDDLLDSLLPIGGVLK